MYKHPTYIVLSLNSLKLPRCSNVNKITCLTFPIHRSTLPACYFVFRMALPVELNPYEDAKCVQMYGWKCLICSVEAKDQVGLNCSILLMALCTSIVLMDQSGYAALNVGKHTMCLVSALISQNQQNCLFSTFLECK